MFVLDTDVLSAIMRSEPVPAVARWMAKQPPNALFTTTICQAEILSGITIMAQGRRRNELEAAARTVFLEDFPGRVLTFDSAAAVSYSQIFALR